MAHLNQFVGRTANLCLCVQQNSRLYRIYLGSPPSVEDLKYGLMGLSDQIRVLGSCNGRLCIINVADEINVWDPSTRQSMPLPHSAVEIRRPSALPICVYGFGCDVKNGAFKLLRLIQLATGQRRSEVSIYNMMDQTWRQLPEIAYNLVYPDKMGVFAYGRLHLIVTLERLACSPAKLLLAFDCHTEEFEEVELPHTIDKKCDMVVAVLDGRLCLSIDRIDMFADVWILGVYGSQESWARVFSIPKYDDDRIPRFVWPLACSEDDRHVLVRRDNKDVVWYDLHARYINRVDIRGMPSSFKDAYVM